MCEIIHMPRPQAPAHTAADTGILKSRQPNVTGNITHVTVQSRQYVPCSHTHKVVQSRQHVPCSQHAQIDKHFIRHANTGILTAWRPVAGAPNPNTSQHMLHPGGCQVYSLSARHIQYSETLQQGCTQSIPHNPGTLQARTTQARCSQRAPASSHDWDISHAGIKGKPRQQQRCQVLCPRGCGVSRWFNCIEWPNLEVPHSCATAAQPQ